MRWVVIVAVVLMSLPCYIECVDSTYSWGVCIDPGHGGSDPGTNCGAGGGDFTEAELTWEVGYKVYQRLSAILDKDSPSFHKRVSITRPQFGPKLEPWERAKIGQGVRKDAAGYRVKGGDSTVADAFISIHFNTWDATLNGSFVIVYTDGGYDRDHPCLNPPLDSCYAQAKDLISCFVLITDEDHTGWDAAARENGRRWELSGSGDMFQPPNDGVVGYTDGVRMLSDGGWFADTIPDYKAQCLIECEFLTNNFCRYLTENKDKYTDKAAEAIVQAVLLYEKRGNPGGRERIVRGF